MAVEIPDAVVEVSVAKSAVEKKKSSKKRRHTEGDAPDVANETASKDKKKKKKSKSSSEANGEVVEEVSMADDLVDVSSKLEKKKKRKREELADGEDKKDKKDKKRRKSESGDIQAEIAEAPETVKPSKKDKKHPKPSADSAEPELSVKSNKKPKKEKKAKNTEVSEPVASSSRVDPSPVVIEEFLKKHSISVHGTTPLTPILSFDQLDIPAGLRAACNGFKEPTPIQACSWPATLAGQDVVGIAETGSGKTLAFGLPALARLLSGSIPEPSKGSGTVSVLVVAPTRELAIQTHDTLSALGKPFGIASVAVFGGMDKRGQVEALRQRKGKDKSGATTRIIVGTPGRILDLVNDGACDLSNVRYLVLDEADRMLDTGFENDIRNIIGHTMQGEARQTLMFSATWPDAVRRLAASFQRDPVRVTVGSDDLTANSRVEQIVEVFDENREKDFRLLGHLRKLIPKKQVGTEETRILIFALYKKESSRVEGMLRSKGFSVGALHGDMSQSARIEALQNFKTGKTGLLVATDVAARGLDIPNVAAVINYTFPLTIEDYIHRIGRTGRGGKSGKSITFFTGDGHERALAGELARVLRESGFEAEGLKKFPMTIKKKTHSAYGAFFRDDIAMPSAPTKITFE